MPQGAAMINMKHAKSAKIWGSLRGDFLCWLIWRRQYVTETFCKMSREARFGWRLNIMFGILVHLHKGLSLLSKYIISKEFSSYSAEIYIAKIYCLGNNVRFSGAKPAEGFSSSEFLMLFRCHFQFRRYFKRGRISFQRRYEALKLIFALSNMKLWCIERSLRREVIIIRQILSRQIIRLQFLKVSEYCA